MAFRQQRDEWSEFVRQHADELRACGVSQAVFRDRQRFFAFLDHGFDQWGWAKSPHDFFDSQQLADEQIARLADFVAHNFSEEYRVLIGSRWQRAW
jgi:hypothetical protein